MRALHLAAGPERLAELQPLRRAHQLDGHHPLGVLHNLAQLERPRHAHRDMVFLASVCGNAAGGRGVREHLALVDERRRHNLRDHEPGRARQIGQHNGRVIKRIGQRSPVKIPPRKYRSAIFRGGRSRGKDKRIVRSRAGLDLQDSPHMLEYVAHGAMHLWHTAQAIRVLHARVVLAVRFANLRIGEQLDQVLRGPNLACVRPGLVDARIEGRRRARQRLQAHRARQIGQLCHPPRARHGQSAHRGHRLRSVQQCEPLFGP